MATYTLADCSQEAFEFCNYNQCAPGDTIILPAGSATWGAASRPNQGTIYVLNAITVKGQGDSTVITLDETGKAYANGVIALWASGITWRDMKIVGAQDRPVTAFQVAANNQRITNVTYEGRAEAVEGGDNGAGYFLFSQGYSGILIDHCRIYTPLGNHEWIFTRGPSNAWQSTNKLGTSDVDVVVEDCTFTGTGYSDANANAKHVFRFNTIEGVVKLDGHGFDSNTPARSCRHVEYYNNTWTSAAMSSAAAIEIRGGSGMVFNNTAASGLLYLRSYAYDAIWPNYGKFNVSITAGSPVTIVTQSPHGYQTGWPIFIDCGAQNLYGTYIVTVVNATTFTVVDADAISGTGYNVRRNYTAYDYPLPDQIGNGRDGAAREPMYLWGNTRGGSAWPRTVATPTSTAQTLYAAQTGVPGATFTERDVIQANRDFFATAGFDTATGVQVGTRAEMDAYTPAITGYGWWVTDEGSWNTLLPVNTSGRLYRWSGSAWVLHYTPYTYPHPSQTATEVAMPTTSVAAGTYEYAQTVSLALNPIDATCRYTTDGSTPSQSVGTIYSGDITISATTTLKAIAYKTGLSDSPILSALYTITNQVAEPTSNTLSGEFHGTQTVSLATSTSGATIYYTTDGSTPTSGSATYSGAISVSVTTTVKAIAIKSGLTDSSVLSIAIVILLEVGNWNVLSVTEYPVYANTRTGFAYFVAPITGTLEKISVYGSNSSGTQDIEFGLYSGTGISTTLTKITGTPASFSNIGTWSNAWHDFVVSFAVTAGQGYWIWLTPSQSSSLTITGVYQGGNTKRWNGPTATYGTAWPSTIGTTSNTDGWSYNVKGLIVEPEGADTTPPTPNPSTIASVTVDGTAQITVVATTATDATNPPTMYNHAINGTYQGWQSSATRVFTALAPGVSYAFKVKARDAVPNETTESAVSNASTNSVVTGTPSPLGNRGTRRRVAGVF